jgi:Fic family protein
MYGVRGQHQTPGEFRRSQNWIGPPGTLLQDATYVPPPAEEMEQALYAFESYLHSKPDFPPLVRLALIHYQFEAIHPFLDGNGRLGRLLISLLLCQWNLLPQPLLYLSAYFEHYRQDYYDLLLTISRDGHWREWILFFLRGVESQARDAIQRAKVLQDLQADYRLRLQHTRASALPLKLVDILFESPYVTISLVQARLETTHRTASLTIQKLVEVDILDEVGSRSRNKIFVAAEILRVTSTS